MGNDAEIRRPEKIEGLRVLVTGGGTGIGLAIADALRQDGARVCISGRNEATLQAAKAQLGPADQHLKTMSFSVADRESCFKAIEELSADWGGVDAVVNNAGIYKYGSFINLLPEQFEELFQTNVVGVVNLMQAVLPQMMSRRRGRIVNIASTAGKWGSVNQSAYNVSKHALVGLTRCVALEMAEYGITVNAVCPGLVETEMGKSLIAETAHKSGLRVDQTLDQITKTRIPMKRVIAPSEIGGLVAYMLSPGAGGMTGQSVLYDGGALQI